MGTGDIGKNQQEVRKKISIQAFPLSEGVARGGPRASFAREGRKYKKKKDERKGSAKGNVF